MVPECVYYIILTLLNPCCAWVKPSRLTHNQSKLRWQVVDYVVVPRVDFVHQLQGPSLFKLYLFSQTITIYNFNKNINTSVVT